jgi:hypothetical protein
VAVGRTRRRDAARREGGAQPPRVRAHPFAPPRLGARRAHRLERRGGQRRRARRREHERPRPVEQQLAQRRAPGDERAHGAERLAERAHGHVDRPLDAPVLRRPRAGRAQHARPVRIVHVRERAVRARQRHEPVERVEVAVHRVHASTTSQRRRYRPRVGGRAAVERVGVGVRDDAHGGAVRLAQSAARRRATRG